MYLDLDIQISSKVKGEGHNKRRHTVDGSPSSSI